MLEVASLCCVFLAFGMLYSSRTTRNQRRGQSSRERLEKLVLRSLAALIVLGALALWSSSESRTAAALVVPVAFMLSAVTHVIGSEFWPNALRTLTFLCPPAAGVLVALEVLGG